MVFLLTVLSNGYLANTIMKQLGLLGPLFRLFLDYLHYADNWGAFMLLFSSIWFIGLYTYFNNYFGYIVWIFCRIFSGYCYAIYGSFGSKISFVII